MTVLMIALGAFVGAPARYVADRAVQSRHETVFPWGTLTVNIVASTLLGILTGTASHLNPHVVTLAGTGFCGALSTFSTFSYETMRLTQENARLYTAANIALSLVAGIGAAAIGLSLGLSIS